MLESLSGSDLLNELAHEFAERYRRGERPSLAEYAERHPDLAAEIREIFPTLVMMEQFGSGVDSQSGRGSSRARPDEPVPESLGDYRIVREIGRGGMGIVYEAVQESLGRRVALKVLSQHRLMGSVQLQRFEREAKAAALLHHTNIVPVFGVGEHEGVHYYAMQYIEGQSLDTVFSEIVRLRGRLAKDGETSPGKPARLAESLLTHRLLELRTPLEMKRTPPSWGAAEADSPGDGDPISDSSEPVLDLSSSTTTMLGDSDVHYFRSVARLGMQAAEALAYAHQHKVLHRDIKPANLLLDLRGTVWVTDFGLAKAEGALELTSPGDVVGTLRYLAPERFRGKADPRSDIYSLGLSLYEMLTFAPAFEASHRVEYIHAILHEEPQRPRDRDPRIPLDLETIVLKSISKNPSERYKGADEMARELGRFVEGRPILSRRASLYERVWRWSRRNRTTAALVLVAASLTSILLIGSTAAAWKFREQRNAVQAEEEKTRSNLSRALRAERDRKAELGRSLLIQARAVRDSGRPGRRADALETLSHAAQIAHQVNARPEELAELRDEVIAALALLDDHTTKTWSGLPPVDFLKTSSVESGRLAEVGRDGLIHVYRLSDRAKVRVVGGDRPSGRSWPAFVSGGRFLQVIAENSVELWDLEHGRLCTGWPDDVSCVAARADGLSVAALRSNGELRVIELPAMTIKSSCALGFDVGAVMSRAFMSLAQDGKHLALIRFEQRVAVVYDVTSGGIVREIKLPTARVGRAVALSRNGGLLAMAHDRAISVFDVVDGEQLAMLQGHQSEGIFAQFQPGGNLLATTAWDGTTRLWDPIRGHLLVTLDGAFREWFDDGKSLVLARNQELVQKQIAVGTERRSIDYRMLGDRAGAALYGPARVSFSPDGRLLAMAARPEGVRIARIRDGAGLALLPIGYCDEAVFMPGGDLLTCNARGLCRWPMRQIGPRALSIGPPVPLAAIAGDRGYVHRGLAVSALGNLVGAGSLGHGSILLDPDHPWRRTLLVPHSGAADLAISSDGRWAASGSRGDSVERRRVKVWDAGTGKVLLQLPLGNARVAFSPDSRWLGVGGKARYRFFRIGTWTPGPVIEYGEHVAEMPLAFHPSSRIAAVLEANQSIVQIVDVESGSILARLDAPDQSLIHFLEFSADGRYLAAAQSDQRVDLWDLWAIRQRIDVLGLAEGIPDVFGGGGTDSGAAEIERIEVRGASPEGLKILAARHVLRTGFNNFVLFFEPNLSDPEALFDRGNSWQRMGRWQQAVADYRASLAGRSESSDSVENLSIASTANELAWALASVPGRGSSLEAISWARKAVERMPDSAAFHNTLGAALYRARHYSEAVDELESNIPRNTEEYGMDLVFLSMCRQRLGQYEEARNALAGARDWQSKIARLGPREAADFAGFVREAELAKRATTRCRIFRPMFLPAKSRFSPLPKKFDPPVTNRGFGANESVGAVAFGYVQKAATIP